MKDYVTSINFILDGIGQTNDGCVVTYLSDVKVKRQILTNKVKIVNCRETLFVGTYNITKIKTLYLRVFILTI